LELRKLGLEGGENLEGLQRDQVVFAASRSPLFWFVGANLHFRIDDRELFVGREGARGDEVVGVMLLAGEPLGIPVLGDAQADAGRMNFMTHV